MGLIIWSQIQLKNSSENFHSDITHPKLVLKYVATKKSTVEIMSLYFWCYKLELLVNS